MDRFYLIGIDAAPLWIIKKLYKKYKLNGFAHFIDQGFLGNMESTLAPMTGAAWPSIYTGLTPGEHGCMDFFTIDKEYTKQLAYYDSSRFPPFWEVLAKKQIHCLLITPAMVLQPGNNPYIDMITGFPLPARFSSRRIEKAAKNIGFSGEPSKIEQSVKDGKLSIDQASKQYVVSIEKRSELAKSLIANNDYQFVFVCFTETDRLQHFSLNRSDWEPNIARLYGQISNFIEWTIKQTKESGDRCAIALISDHGAQPINNKFLINGWLINQNYAALKDSVIKGIKSDNTSTQNSSIKYNLRETLLKSGMRKAYDKMPSSAKRVVSKAVGGVLSGASGGNYTRLHDFDFNFAKTVAFGSISNDPVSMIFINDKRFASPTVSQSQKTKLKNKITNELSKLKSEEGQKLIVNIYDGDKYYDKTKLFIHPDLLIEACQGYTIDVFNYSTSKIFQKPEAAKSGDHIRNGIFGITTNYDTNIKSFNRKHIDVYSIKPLILEYFGINPTMSKATL